MRPNRTLVAAVAALALLTFAVNVTFASPPSGVTPTLLARGTYDSFKVRARPDNGCRREDRRPIPCAGFFKAEANQPIDMVVRRHDYTPGGSTGWHAHPYPVFITVISGQVTFYEADDPTCSPHVVSAGQGYVDSGRGHIGRNESGAPAVDISVIMAPVGAPFREELTAPGRFCAF